MALLHLLGTGAAVSDPGRTTTMLAVENKDGLVAIDCGGDLFQRLLLVDAHIDRLEALILTHEHPDHVSGFPLFMQKLWLGGRRKALPVIGPESAVNVAGALWKACGLENESGMPDVRWISMGAPDAEAEIPLDSWICRCAPVSHGPVTIGLRFEDPETGQSVAYSADTAPDPRVTALARDVDILVHEASGSGNGHSGVDEAAQIALAAHARRLVLVHIPRESSIPERAVRDAQALFPGYEIGADGATHEISGSSQDVESFRGLRRGS